VLTKGNRELRLYLNGNLQFSSLDEYRYHEALVHPGMRVCKRKNVLVLGGGDGMAVREILKYPEVEKITLVDLDPAVTELFKRNEALTALNDSALLDKRVTVLNKDAFVWIKECKEKYDFVAVDFPDPSNYSIGKLYSTVFYKELNKIIADDGVAVIQSTSPFVAPKSYWCVDTTLRANGFYTQPYHVHVPSFGDWGFIMASKIPQEDSVPGFLPHLRFLTNELYSQLCIFPKDMSRVKTEVNRLNNQVLVHYFEEEWAVYLH
jgi:spermidine synthase